MNGITAGTGTLEMAGNIWHFTEKSVLLVPPDLPHTYRFEGLVTKTYAHFRCATTGTMASIPEMQDLGDRYSWYHSSIMECRNWVLIQPGRSLATLWHLLWQLAHGPVGASGPGHHPAVQSLLRYMETHLDSPVNVNVLSRELDISPAHLNRLCQSTFGVSTANLVRRLRLDRAIHLLSHTPTPIAVIAATVGYPDLQHFNKIIRSFTGRSPRQLRKES